LAQSLGHRGGRDVGNQLHSKHDRRSVNLIPIVGTAKGLAETGIKAAIKGVAEVLAKDVTKEVLEVCTKETVEAATKEISQAARRAGPLPAGEQPYQLRLFPDQPYNRPQHYGRTPTAAQQASVPSGMEFDHNPTLVQHYYEGPGDGSLPGFNLTQTERVEHGASLGSGAAATPGAQRSQGATATQYSKQQKKKWGF